MIYPTILQDLLKKLQRLPGIGLKTAERLAFHILKASDQEVFELADAIRAVKEKVKKCQYCFNITEENPCSICSNPRRDHGMICVVEQPKDLIAIEKTAVYQGTYHVLMGHVAPLENEHAEHLTIDALIDRIQKSVKTDQPVREVIIATNPNLEGDTTALYLLQALQDCSVTVTQMARGISSGASIEFASEIILTEALNNRKKMK
ncbi:MAG: recombination protein RecR [Planctomycetes bacterium]|jgi:recombination protein RecR|nr:recombination protein RecR [Planctomycetota bacterium]HNZ65738.1 recombination mediator RecR [Planctomycetota bacterium]HPY74700.1 recombination mediator RecR [Planctomycetota bacterium]HQB00267.1 recombination mediator RecR [Planctomycetota bacterium]